LTYASWLNPVEYWFSALQRHVLARGSLAGVADLRDTLGRYVRGHNLRAMP
jgi:transposase